MTTVVGIAAKVLGALGALAALTLGATFTVTDRSRYPLLRRLHGRQAHLFFVAAVCLLLQVPLDFLGDRLKEQDARNATTADFERLRAVLGDSAVPREAVGNLVTVQSDRLGAAVSLAIRSEESYQRKDYREALSFLRQADRLAAIAPIKARIADCYFALGDYVQTIAYEEQATALSPEWSGPPYMVGLSYLRLGREEEALEAFNRSCDLGFDAACNLVRSRNR